MQQHSSSEAATSRLKGKMCLITGAGRGIGEAIAREFSRQGATVIVSDISYASVCRLADDISGYAIELDVREEAHWQACAEQWPAVDVVVNNAGVTGFENLSCPVSHDPENASLEDWRAVHAVNLDGTFLGCRYAIQAMRASGAGSIINISSRSGFIGVPMAAAYASSKAAVRNHSKSVALYCAQQGLNIRRNSIHPAAVLTPMWEPLLGQGQAREVAKQQLVQDTPMRRFGQPEEVAALAVMLASDEAMYMTGAELTIDGGILAGSAASPPVPE